jgi:hypothetical protein
MYLLFGVVIFVLASMACGLAWFLVLRPFAIAHGMIPPTAYDYVVRGWKAERRGDWATALAEYEKAIESNPRYPEGRLRRDALLEAHPELANRRK